MLSPAFGAPGDLDLTFGSGGKVNIDFGSSSEYGSSVAVQSDGKIVVAGSSFWNLANKDFALARYTTTGAFDTSFGNGGKVTTAIGNDDDVGVSVAVQSDGKIIVAGYSWNGSYSDFALVRYTTAGALDASFGSGGKVITPVSSSYDFGRSVALQSDGKIVVAGDSYNGSNYDFALVRYTASGALDASFGSGGKVTTAIGSNNDGGYTVALQNDGKIVVAGYSSNGSNSDFALVRYMAAGALDTSFGNGGKVTTAIGSSTDIGNSVAVESDGKIVVAGYSTGADGYADFALARYTAAGALDASFGSGGKVITPVSSNDDHGYSVAVQSDGKIVVAGYSSNGSNSDFALVRYTAAGALDASFGSGGKVITDLGSKEDYGYSVALHSDGKIIVAGSSIPPPGTYNFALARYEGNAPAPLANWRLTYFGTTGNSGNAADLAAPDGDGIVNLIKYGLVIVPGTSGASSLPQGQRKVYAEGARLALVFLHDSARNDISLEVQAADHPDGPWTTVASSVGGAIFSGPGFVSETAVGGGLNTVEVRDIVNIADAPHRYMHIKVTH